MSQYTGNLHLTGQRGQVSVYHFCYCLQSLLLLLRKNQFFSSPKTSLQSVYGNPIAPSFYSILLGVEESCALNQPSNPAQLINCNSVHCTDNQTCLYAVHTEASQTRDIPSRLESADSATWPLNTRIVISCKIHKIQISFPNHCPNQCQTSDEDNAYNKPGVMFCKPTDSRNLVRSSPFNPMRNSYLEYSGSPDDSRLEAAHQEISKSVRIEILNKESLF